jgi:hypothetical protein
MCCRRPGCRYTIDGWSGPDGAALGVALMAGGAVVGKAVVGAAAAKVWFSDGLFVCLSVCLCEMTL